jgi:hypothetical protein
MKAVEFDIVGFREGHPQFADMGDAELGNYFRQSAMMIGNSDDSPIPYDPPKKYDRQVILDLLTCHLATLAAWGKEGKSGPITQASQGDVGVSFGTLAPQAGTDWYNQTPCGQTAWMLLKRFLSGGLYFTGKGGRRRG